MANVGGSFDQQLPKLGKSRAVLIHGADPIMIAEYRTRLANHVLGEAAGDELAKVVLNADEVRSDDGTIEAALKEQGMFGDARVVLVDGITMLHRKALERAFESSSAEDYCLIATAGEQKWNSPLVKLFKEFEHGTAYEAEVPQYSKEEILRYFEEQEVGKPDADALGRLEELRDHMTWGNFQKLLEKLSVYMYSGAASMTVADVDACAPTRHADEADELFDAVAQNNPAEIAEQYSALLAKGDQPVGILIAMEWQFKLLQKALAAGVREISGRPPPGIWVRQDRRAAVNAHLRSWSLVRVETALVELQTADVGLRGSSHIPPAVLAEHVLLRVARLRPKKP